MKQRYACQPPAASLSHPFCSCVAAVQPSFQLKIWVRSNPTNPCLQAYQRVTVVLADTNDYIPTFSPSEIAISLSETPATPRARRAAGDVVYTFVATDSDSGENAVVTYRFKGTNPGQEFFGESDVAWGLVHANLWLCIVH